MGSVGLGSKSWAFTARAGCCSAAIAALVACGGSAITTQPLTQAGASGPASTTIVNGQIAQPFTLTYARAGALTKIGISSSIEANSPEHDVMLGAAAPGCAPSAASTIQCSFTLTLPWGPQALTVTTYGSSVTKTQLKAALGGSRIALSSGVPVAQISLDLQNNYFSTGQATTTNLYVTARDATGNTIVGSLGGTTITVASSDTSGTTSLSGTTVAQSTDSPLTLTYNGMIPNGPTITFTATATGIPASAITSATLSFTAPQLMYVGNQPNVLVFARTTALGDAVPTSRFNLVGYDAYSAAPDGQGNLLVIGSPFGNLVSSSGLLNTGFFKVPASASGTIANPTPFGVVLPTGQFAYDFAVDSGGNLYVLSTDFNGNAAISVFAPGATAPTRVIAGAATTLGTGYLNSIAVSSGGLIAVNQGAAGYTFQLPPVEGPASLLIFGSNASGNVAPVRSISGSATGLSAVGIAYGMTNVAWLNDGSLAVTNVNASYTGSLLVFAPGANGNVAPARAITGGATGLTLTNAAAITGMSSTTLGVVATNGLAADSSNRLYVSEFGSGSGLPAQILRFDPTANGNVVPSGILAGPLTGLSGPGTISFANAALTPPVTPVASVSGDFLALAANRGWNYSAVPIAGSNTATPAPPFTVTLYVDPTKQGTDSILVLLRATGNQATATAGTIAAYMTTNAGPTGYVATGYYAVSNFSGGPIPGGLQLLQPSLTQGQTWAPYPGLTATVTYVGTNIGGSSACPGGGTPVGATVQYSFAPGGNSGASVAAERISYVPGCGITQMITDSGATFTLTSTGTYAQLGQLAEARQPAALRVVRELQSAWSSMFKPW